jgi:hypothetical protein
MAAILPNKIKPFERFPQALQQQQPLFEAKFRVLYALRPPAFFQVARWDPADASICRAES